MPLSLFQKRALVILCGLVAFSLILILPAPEGMGQRAQRLLAVTVLMSIWWIGEAIHISATALLPLILFPLLGIMSSKETAPNYSNHLVFLFLGGFMIALGIEKWNFHKRMAMVIIVVIGTSPGRIVLGFMTATAFLSMWISNTAATMMMLPIAMSVVNQIAMEASLDGGRGDEAEGEIRNSFGLVLMLGIAYSASIGGVGTLIGTPPNIIFMGFYTKLFPNRPEIEFFQWMFFAIPLALIFLPIVWIYLCRFVAPVPMHAIQLAPGTDSLILKELESLGSMSRAEKYIASVFLVTAFLWIFRKPIPLGFGTLPGWSGLFEHPQFLNDSTVAMVMGLLLFLLPLDFKEGIEWEGRKAYFVLDWKTVERGVPWGILLLFGGGFALAAGFNETGLDLWIGSKFSNIADWPQWLVVLTICLSISFLTELTSNTALTTMILPILGSIAISSGLHPLLLMIPATFSSSFAFILPVATPPNAIVFSSGWVSIRQMAKAGIVLNLVGAALTTVLVTFLVRFG